MASFLFSSANYCYNQLIMNESLFSWLLDQFTDLYDKPTASEVEKYLDAFPAKSIEQHIKKNIPLLFHRQWIRASIKGHLRQAKYLSRNIGSTSSEHYYQQSLSWLQQAKNIYEKVCFFANLPNNQLRESICSEEDLKRGDIILSYKTQAYIKNSKASWQVKIFSNSPITHVMAVYREGDGPAELLFSGDKARGLGLTEPKPVAGEIYIILRPKQSVQTEKLNSVLHQWYTKARERTDYTQNEFPELKVQVANLIGIITVIFGYFGLPLALPNPFSKRPGVFCSELIDEMYFEAGIQLTPRSCHPAVVGPIELFYSPHFSLVGVMCPPDEIANLHQEITQQFVADSLK